MPHDAHARVPIVPQQLGEPATALPSPTSNMPSSRVHAGARACKYLRRAIAADEVQTERRRQRHDDEPARDLGMGGVRAMATAAVRYRNALNRRSNSVRRRRRTALVRAIQRPTVTHTSGSTRPQPGISAGACRCAACRTGPGTPHRQRYRSDRSITTRMFGTAASSVGAIHDRHRPAQPGRDSCHPYRDVRAV